MVLIQYEIKTVQASARTKDGVVVNVVYGTKTETRWVPESLLEEISEDHPGLKIIARK